MTIQELKNQILNANAIGRTNLANKGVVVDENSTTYEIMQGIANCQAGGDSFSSEGVTFGYEKKTITNTFTASEGKCFYNGVELPEIPEDVLAEYQYMFIYITSSQKYTLMAHKTVGYWYPTEEYPTCMKADGAFVLYNCNDNGTLWEFGKNGENLYYITPVVLWANYDIPNGSATSTDIYFEGTEVVTSYTTTETVNAPIEREENYSVKSADLSEIAKRTQEMAGTSKLLTTDEILYWLGRVKYVPQGWASNEFELSSMSNAVGILPMVYKGVAKSNNKITVTSSAEGIVTE